MLQNGDLKTIYTLLGVRSQNRAIEEIKHLLAEKKKSDEEQEKLIRRERTLATNEIRSAATVDHLWKAVDSVRSALGEKVEAPTERRAFAPDLENLSWVRSLEKLVTKSRLAESISSALEQCTGFLGRHGVLISGNENNYSVARLVQFPSPPEEESEPWVFHPHFGPVPMRGRQKTKLQSVRSETTLACTVLRAETGNDIAMAASDLAKKPV